MDEDDDFVEGLSFAVELKVTPFAWIEAAQKLGYEFIQLNNKHCRFPKINDEGGFGIIDYSSIGEAAKAACIYETAVDLSEVAIQPERLVTLTDNTLPGATIVTGRSGRFNVGTASGAA